MMSENSPEQQPNESQANVYDDAIADTKNVTVAYAIIKNKKGEFLGAFVPELYELALTNNTQEQLLNGENANRTNFQLAVIPSTKQKDIYKFMVKEYEYRQKNGLPLPAPVSKLRVSPDYLAEGLEEAELEVAAVDAVTLNLPKQKKRVSDNVKKFFHITSWLAFFSTLGLVVGTITNVISLPIYVCLFFALYNATHLADQFDFYGKLESILRDIDWMSNKDFSWIRNFSKFNAFKSIFHLATLGVAMYFTATAVFAGVIGLPFLMLAPKVEAAIGIFLATLTAIGSWVGLSGVLRAGKGISFSDLQVRPTKEDVDGLKPITKRPKLKNNQDIETLREILADDAPGMQNIDGGIGNGNKKFMIMLAQRLANLAEDPANCAKLKEMLRENNHQLSFS